MRFINIVLLELCAVAGSSTFASALPQLFDGQVHQKPITGSCLQESHVQGANISYFSLPANDFNYPLLPTQVCAPIGPGFIIWIRPDTNCDLFWKRPGQLACDAQNRRLPIGPVDNYPNFYANHIRCY